MTDEEFKKLVRLYFHCEDGLAAPAWNSSAVNQALVKNKTEAEMKIREELRKNPERVMIKV